MSGCGPMTAQPRTSPGIWAGPQTPSTPVTSLLTESSTMDVGEQRSVRGRRRRSSTQRSLEMDPEEAAVRMTACRAPAHVRPYWPKALDVQPFKVR